VAKPAIDYFLDTCGYEVVVTSLDKSDADKIIAGRDGGTPVAWNSSQTEQLDRLVRRSDLVLSMLPPHLHLQVAKSCLVHGKNMVTTSYAGSEMQALDAECRDAGILIVNEIGEDPGLDLMVTKRMIDQVQEEQGRVVRVDSYGAGLPSFCSNNNPFGYKFSWSPHGLIAAAQAPAAYLVAGDRVEVAGRDLFSHFWLVDLENIGTFETYPNRDAEKYLQDFGLDEGVSLYRGLLRFPGWCNTMKGFAELGLFNMVSRRSFTGMTYADLIKELIGAGTQGTVEAQLADYLDIPLQSDFMQKVRWLGLLQQEPITIREGTYADVLIERLTEKLAYRGQDRDMVIIYTEISADFTSHREKRVASFLLEGTPGENSAMSRSVSLPAAIAAELVVEKSIALHGVVRPTQKKIYQPVLEKLEKYGYLFITSSEVQDAA